MSNASSGQLGSSRPASTAAGHLVIDIVSESDSSDESSSVGKAAGEKSHYNEGSFLGSNSGSSRSAGHGSGLAQDELYGLMEEQQQAAMVPLSTSIILDRSSFKQEILRGLEPPEFKLTLRFRPVGATPQISPQVFRISSAQTMATVNSFLCKKLKRDLVYVYIQSSFQPSPDEKLGNLYNLFRSGNELVVNYCNTIAFG